MFWKNKGQVTVFIIVGLIILISVIVLAIFMSKTSDSKIEDLGKETAEYERIKNIVDSCIQESAHDALERMRTQGGFVYIPIHYKTIEIDEKDVPYWITKDEEQFPSKEIIKTQLDEYIKLSLISCVDDFQSLKDVGYEVKYEFPIVDTELKNKIIFNIDFRIDAKYSGENVRLNEFEFIKNIDFDKIYYSALKIASNEDLIGYLESDTKRLISLYSGVDENLLPPFSATVPNDDCEHVTWKDDDVKEKLKDILNENIPLIDFKNDQIIGNDEKTKFLNSFIHDVGIKDKNLNIDLDYDKSKDFLYYDVKPNDGPGISLPERVESSSIPLLPKFCNFKYQYKYDLEYPVTVSINDKNSEKSNSREMGFEFKFPLWVFLCGNNERFCSGKAEYIKKGFDINKEIIEESGYIANEYCNKDRWKDKITIDVRNIRNEPIDDASIWYTCGSSTNSCYIGETDNEGAYIGNLPKCMNGVLRIEKDEYGKKSKVISSDNEQIISFTLNKKKDAEVILKKISAKDIVKMYTENRYDIENFAKDISSREDAIITISGDDEYALQYPSKNNEIKISKGDYEYNIILKANMRIYPSYINTQNGELEISVDESGSGIYNGIWPTSNIQNIPMKYQEEDKITLYTIYEFLAEERVEASDILDSIFDSDNNIHAEVLMEQDNCEGKYSVIEVDGINEKDLEAKECQKVEEIKIAKEEYSKILSGGIE